MGKKVRPDKLEKLIRKAGLSLEAAAALRAANEGEEVPVRGHGAPAQARHVPARPALVRWSLVWCGGRKRDCRTRPISC